MKKKNKILKKLIIIGIICYVACIIINQQKTLSSYQATKEYYAEQLQEEKQTNEELVAMQENVTSEEYIEKIAREKLDMYLPNERVYIDVGN